MGDEHHVGIRGRRVWPLRLRPAWVASRGPCPRRVRRTPCVRAAAACSIARRTSPGREVTTLGKDQQRILDVQVRGQVRDARLDGSRALPCGVGSMKRAGSRWKYTSTIGSACMVSFMTTRGSRRWSRFISVSMQQQAVTGSGVPAEHDHRVVGARVSRRRAGSTTPRRSRSSRWNRCCAAQTNDPRHDPEDVIVGALDSRGVQLPAEAADDPQCRGGEERHELDRDPDQREVEQSHRPPSPGQPSGRDRCRQSQDRQQQRGSGRKRATAATARGFGGQAAAAASSMPTPARCR